MRPDIQEMIDDFAFLEDWEERYMHLIELGKALPAFSDLEKTAKNKVNGCVSQVWLITQVSDARPHILTYRGDSDAHIVKGLIAIVIKIFSGQSAQAICGIDAGDIMEQLGLSEHLSAQRTNGLSAMIKRIKTDAHGAL